MGRLHPFFSAFDDLLNAVEVHLAADNRCSCGKQSGVAGVVGGNGNHTQIGMRGATLSNKLVSFAVIEVVIRKNQIEVAGRQGASRRGETGHDRDAVVLQELARDLFGEDGVVFKVENVHGGRQFFRSRSIASDCSESERKKVVTVNLGIGAALRCFPRLTRGYYRIVPAGTSVCATHELFLMKRSFFGHFVAAGGEERK